MLLTMNIQLLWGIHTMALFFMQDSLKDSSSRETFRITDLRWCIFCLGLLVLIAFTGRAFAAPTAEDPNKPQRTSRQKELSKQLEELIRRLRQERSAYYVQKARLETEIEKARENRKILQTELDDLRKQHDESDQQLRKYEAEVENLKEQLVLKESLENVLDNRIRPFIANQQAEIKNGIPYQQQERIGRLEAAVGDVNAPDVVSISDELGHIWNYAQEELRLARSSETYTARAKTDNESSPYARFFRVGQKILGYITEDGRQAAIWSSLRDDKSWMSIDDTKQSAQIRSAVEILDRRQGPRLVTLPIALESKDLIKEDSDASP
jgi:thiol:disulfide interchange protein